MMKALLTLVIACGGLIHAMVPSLAQAQTVAQIAFSSDRVEDENQLDRRSRGVDRDRERRARSYAGLTAGQRTGSYALLSPATQTKTPDAVLITARPVNFVLKDDTEPGDDTYGHPYVKKEDAYKNYLVMYTAEWCIFCHRMYPIIKLLRKEGYIVYVVDADKHPEAAKQHGVENLPTFIIMNKGQEASRIVGACLKGRLKRRLKTREEQEKETPKPQPETKIPKLY
jgi:thioredoxin 1